jgi:hypothetical protein
LGFGFNLYTPIGKSPELSNSCGKGYGIGTANGLRELHRPCRSSDVNNLTEHTPKEALSTDNALQVYPKASFTAYQLFVGNYSL